MEVQVISGAQRLKALEDEALMVKEGKNCVLLIQGLKTFALVHLKVAAEGIRSKILLRISFELKHTL